MKNLKLGRPTNSLKEDIIKVRVDSEVKNKLDFCATKLRCTKSEVLRMGIENIYNELKKEVKK